MTQQRAKDRISRLLQISLFCQHKQQHKLLRANLSQSSVHYLDRQTSEMAQQQQHMIECK